MSASPMKFLSLLTLFLFTFPHSASAAPRFEFKEGEMVAFLGDSFIEREQYAGWIELAATTQFPDRNVTFRNLGWSADTPAGDSRNGRSLLQAGLEPAGEGWDQLLKQLSEYKPDVILIGYGTAASLPGGNAPDAFLANLTRLLDEVPKATGKETRFLILGTSPREDNNRQAIETILSETATKRNIHRDIARLGGNNVGQGPAGRNPAPAHHPQKRMVFPSLPPREHGLHLRFPQRGAG